MSDTTTKVRLTMEERIQSIEMKVGILSQNHPNASQLVVNDNDNVNDEDVVTRIQRLYESTVVPIRAHGGGALEQELQACATLEEDLSPGSLLTHQIQSSQQPQKNSSSSTAPLIYRRQELIACAEDFRANLQVLAQMKALLGNVQGKIKTATDSPILDAPGYHYGADEVNRQRLGAVTARVVEAQAKASKLDTRLDVLLHMYQRVMEIASEKLILAHEELLMMEMEKKRQTEEGPESS